MLLQDLKPGVNVFRYANRIPLLFEGGSDVITRTATKRINWCGASDPLPFVPATCSQRLRVPVLLLLG